MAGDKINKAKRMAASHMCFMVFQAQTGLAHTVRQIAHKAPPGGSDGLGDGLTAKERDFLLRMATSFHEQGQTFRKLGHRFKGSKA